MIKIKELLLKFNNLINSKELQRQTIQDVVFEIFGFRVELEKIENKKNIIYLKIKPTYKNEMFLKKDLFFLKLKELLGDKTPEDLR